MIELTKIGFWYWNEKHGLSRNVLCFSITLKSIAFSYLDDVVVFKYPWIYPYSKHRFYSTSFDVYCRSLKDIKNMWKTYYKSVFKIINKI